MKKIFFISAIAILIFACKKEKTEIKTTPPAVTKSCSINISLVQDINWHQSNTSFATLRFASTGIYYENSIDDGHWTLSNGCDSIYITRPSNNFYYRIKSVTKDTLIIFDPVFGESTHYK